MTVTRISIKNDDVQDPKEWFDLSLLSILFCLYHFIPIKPLKPLKQGVTKCKRIRKKEKQY